MMVRVETEASFWLLDDDLHRYCRMPKTESPRKPGWWDEPEPGTPLMDLEWHPMDSWEISPLPVPVKRFNGVMGEHSLDSCPILVIHSRGAMVLAPKAIYP